MKKVTFEIPRNTYALISHHAKQPRAFILWNVDFPRIVIITNDLAYYICAVLKLHYFSVKKNKKKKKKKKKTKKKKQKKKKKKQSLFHQLSYAI